MAGYWPISFFVCFHGWRRSQGLCKQGTRQISSYFDQQTRFVTKKCHFDKNKEWLFFFFFFWELGKKASHVPNTINPQESFNMFSWFVCFFFPTTFYELFNSTPWNSHGIEAGNSERARCAHLACLLGNQSKHKICTILPTGAVSNVKDDMTVPELLAF